MTEEKIPVVNENKTPAPPPPMRKRKPTLVIILLVLLSIVFVLTSVLAVLGYDVWRVAFNPPLVKQMLADEFIDSPLIPRVLEDISLRRAQQRIDQGEALSGVNEPDIMLLISFVDYEQWSEIKELVVTDEFITHLISVSVDGFYAWLDSPDPVPQFVWEMDELKSRLVGQQGEDAIMIAYGSLPECTDDEIADFESRLAAMPPGVEVLYNLCQFPEPWQEDQIDDYIHSLVDINQNVPDEYNFSQMLGGSSASAIMTLVKTALRATRVLGQFMWAIPLVVLALMAAIAVRSWGDAGRWLGIPLVISGALVVGGTVLTRSTLLTMIYTQFSAAISTLLRAEIKRSFFALSGHIFQPMLIQGAVILGAGVLMIVAWVVWGKKGKGKAKIETEA